MRRLRMYLHAWRAARRQHHLPLAEQALLVWRWSKGRIEGPFCSEGGCDEPVVSGTRLCFGHRHRAATPEQVDAAIAAALD